MIEPLRIVPLSESAITVEFGDTITLENNQKAVSLANDLTQTPFEGMIEAVPAYASTTIYFDMLSVKGQFPDKEAIRSVEDIVRERLSRLDVAENNAGELVTIQFTPDNGEFDLESVAKSTNLTVNEVIERFTAPEYRIYMLGFLPGFAYLGTLDDRLVLPRKSTPRQHVPAGSVAIVGRQAGVYPLDSPGGWHIIGNTGMEMFSPEASEFTALKAGQRVRFEVVS